MRLDQWLHHNQLAKSRSQAEEMITRGEVQIFNTRTSSWLTPTKPSYKVEDSLTINEVKIDSPLTQYASRGGLKLLAAIQKTGLVVKGFKFLDIGQSTGGFTDCLLQHGAQTVVGIDVGSGQLVSELKSNPQVISFESLDIREAQNNSEFMKLMPVDGVVIDVSFISLLHVLPSAISFLKPGGRILALVKPQFELTKGDLDKRGIVKSQEKLSLVKNKITDYVKEKHLGQILDYFESAEKGRDGNVEFFIFIEKQ